MDEGVRIVVEMHQWLWARFRGSFDDITQDEIDWRFVPQANSINVIVRHLRIEGEWHVRSLESGEPMPTIAVPASQPAIDAVALDFKDNLDALERAYAAFSETLRAESLASLSAKTAAAYGPAVTSRGRVYMLAYHQALHLTHHTGQIHTIRNLYRKMRGEPARFHPDNPTYPRNAGAG